MPLTVRNAELYVDRTVQHWHRRTFGRFDDAIDIDLMGVCHQCRHPLYVMEASTNPDKVTRIVRIVAEALGVPAFLVLHADGEVIGGHYFGAIVGFGHDCDLTHDQLITYVEIFRDAHVCD